MLIEVRYSGTIVGRWKVISCDARVKQWFHSFGPIGFGAGSMSYRLGMQRASFGFVFAFGVI